MNVSLIGMSGSGKSSVGVQVADALELAFVDIDAVIEMHAGEQLPAIITELGDAGFVRIEAAATEKACDGDNQLISTGGSIVYSESAMESLRERTRVIYLRVSKPTLLKRIRADVRRKDRIIGSKSKSLEDIIDERLPLYEAYAHATVDAETGGDENIVARIVEAALVR